MAKRNDDGYQRYAFIYEMERLYLERPFSDAEMGERLDTDRTNVYRIRKIMTEMMDIPIEPAPDARGQYYIHPDYNIRHIPFSREQMVELYLAGRRLQQQTRTSQRFVGDALEKLSHALRKPLASSLVRAAQVVMDQEQDPQQEAVFATLVECWLNGIPVRITHRKHHGQPHVYRVHPYQLEPSVWGDGTYLIGYSEWHGKLATFKTARIEKAVPGTGQFEVPADFDVHELLNHAWGVWHADEEPVTVRLRFNKWVTPRVRETIWHPAQTIIVKDDGSCEWQAPVAEWREMVPWVRGWGSDCEVIEPAELREFLIAETGRLSRLYETQTRPPGHRLLWAKTDKTGNTHPLFCHLIDVGHVALALWNGVLTQGFRTQIADALGLDSQAAGRLFAFWSAAHDIGKACPNFQRKFDPARSLLEEAGFTFPTLYGKNTCYHATVSALVLPQLLETETELDPALGFEVAQALGGHHGSWPTSTIRQQHETQIGDERWQKAQRALLRELVDLFDPPTVTRLGRNDEERGAVLVLLSGLTSVADWIGSMSEYFYFSSAHVAPELYVGIAARRAARVLQKLGWTGWSAAETPRSFAELHDFTPRPAQQAVIDVAPGETEPTLVIVEVSTGAGKTELALYLADRWAALRAQRGLYVAMPTQATSNQMYDRVGRFLHKRYPEEQVNYHLIHSGARWRDDLPDFNLETADESSTGTLQAMSWFLPRKRTLLAPFAVGTVDQALLSTLQTRHFFVRLFGLSRKTIIFDEVHAYDTYMNTLFQRLLGWLRAVGSSVIVLSATLPAATRRALVEAYRGTDDGIDALDGTAYPAVTVASANELQMKPLPAGSERTIEVEWIGHAPDAIVETLRACVQEEGCVAVICNRVARAQEIYTALRDAQLVPDGDLLLFHARTPSVWRNAIEADVLERFGKDGDPQRRRGIVVATQVIEQSLDLDFDLMVTDLAPVDLILQRAGRLHRHVRPWRPPGLDRPRLLVTAPETGEEDVPDFGGDALVYEPYVLLRSWLALRANGAQLTLPEQTVALIEAVYGDETALPEIPSPMQQQALNQARQVMEQNERKAQVEAHNRLVAPPGDEDLLWLRNDLLEEDNPDVHNALQALTRLIQPAVSLVCLHNEAGGVALDPGGMPGVDLAQKPTPDLTKKLAQRIVNVTHPVVRRYFLEQEVPKGWRDHTLLNNHRVALFTGGECPMEGTNYRLRLSRDLGLVIEKANSDESGVI